MLTPTRAGMPELLFSGAASPRRAQETPSPASTSFAQQLAGALEAYLNQAEPGAHLEIDITPQQGQDSGARQFLVTFKDTSSTLPGTVAPMSVSVAPVAASSSPGASAGPAATTPQFTDQKDAYWAAQPEAVRVLRDMPDLNERYTKGWQLANQGYSIDTDIMIYHSDPWKTMANRNCAGYKWVPALGQAPVLQPGIVFTGMKTYEPNNPPPGAIPVNMEMFRGLERTSIWCTEDDVLPS
jgi:hypothetical protein